MKIRPENLGIQAELDFRLVPGREVQSGGHLPPCRLQNQKTKKDASKSRKDEEPAKGSWLWSLGSLRPWCERNGSVLA